ncbi:MAG: alkaline phosphatase family protein, partial [Deltaproteobacteria bacterium]|nr:alkaline phosphatase family protein [Deltaproteobacteria bacterium]
MKARLFSVVMIPLLAFVFSAWAVAGTVNEKPKLIVQITIDQMRGDFPMRYKDRLGEGGFRYLMGKGTHYINAHFQHADTETPIGHAALFTGTYPAYNGIVAGNWFDMDKGKVIYNCEDDRYPM